MPPTTPPLYCIIVAVLIVLFYIIYVTALSLGSFNIITCVSPSHASLSYHNLPTDNHTVYIYCIVPTTHLVMYSCVFKTGNVLYWLQDIFLHQTLEMLVNNTCTAVCAWFTVLPN